MLAAVPDEVFVPESIEVVAQLSVFERQRSRMMGISYRILGSVTDAEDVLQEAWLRCHDIDWHAVENPEAWLTTVVTRLSLDRLRKLKARREVYSGPWVLELVATEDPEAAVERVDSLSLALLLVLETLSQLERAAFVLREVFQEPYPEVAKTLGRNQPTVRQLVHRARERVTSGAARYQVDRAAHEQVVRQFIAATRSADLTPLLEVLAPDVVVINDVGDATAPRRRRGSPNSCWPTSVGSPAPFPCSLLPCCGRGSTAPAACSPQAPIERAAASPRASSVWGNQRTTA